MVRMKFPSSSSGGTYLFRDSSLQFQNTICMHNLFNIEQLKSLSNPFRVIYTVIQIKSLKNVPTDLWAEETDVWHHSFSVIPVFFFSSLLGYHLCQGAFAYSQSTDWWFQIDALSIFWILECIFMADIKENKFTGDILCDTYVVFNIGVEFCIFFCLLHM